MRQIVARWLVWVLLALAVAAPAHAGSGVGGEASQIVASALEQIYGYDAPTASRTPGLDSRPATSVARRAARGAWRSSTSSFLLRRAAKAGAGAADDGARLATGRFLSDSWHRATFPDKTQIVRYHRQKHVRDQGLNKSVREYTEDALGVFQQHRSAAQQITLKDGTPGLRIKTGKGQPGGIYTPDGRVVTFWYR